MVIHGVSFFSFQCAIYSISVVPVLRSVNVSRWRTTRGGLWAISGPWMDVRKWWPKSRRMDPSGRTRFHTLFQSTDHRIVCWLPWFWFRGIRAQSLVSSLAVLRTIGPNQSSSDSINRRLTISEKMTPRPDDTWREIVIFIIHSWLDSACNQGSGGFPRKFYLRVAWLPSDVFPYSYLPSLE